MNKSRTNTEKSPSSNHQKKETTKGCPFCSNSGVAVSTVTVKHLVKQNIQIISEINNFRICMNPECDIVYYCRIPEISFVKNQIRVPVWFKLDADPKYACYCSQVTEQQVLDAVRNHGAKTVNDINRITGAMEVSNCIQNNPLGICCHKIIQSCIDKANQNNI